MSTRTGNFPIGFRRGWSDWQKNDLKSLSNWAKSSGFDAIDLGRTTAPDMQILRDAGLRIGSVDLLDFGQIMAADSGKRRDVIAANVAYVKEAAAIGAKVLFTCVIPGDPSKRREENYALAVQCFSPIAQAAQDAGSVVVIEGWPGGGSLPNLCCTPETYRSFIKDVNPKSVGVNYDPSHLIRMGVDPIRFVREFAPNVYHVHGKDTEIFTDAIYEYGLYQGSAFGKQHAFGEWVWRYTIPGHGSTPWGEVFKTLKSVNYRGVVSVELEDENFNGSEAGEKAGLLHSLAFLRGV